MKPEPWTSPHCRLAAQLERYADQHERCPVVEDVRVADGTLVFHSECVCTCHTRESAVGDGM